MNCKLPMVFAALLFLLSAALPVFGQEEFREWTPPDGVTLRQGWHIEWFRGGETRKEGNLAGETAFVWSDCRNGDRGVFMQVIDTDGNFKYADGGAQIADSTGRQEDPGVWPDPDGGWFVAWEDFDIWFDDEGNAFGDSLGNIYCTKLDANGNMLWGDDERGLPVIVYPGIQEDVRIVHDGQGGCIIAWRDMRGGDTGDIYAQHILSDGRIDPDWPADGLPVVVEAGPQTNHTADIDGNGGMIIGWKDGREVGDFNIWAQRITPDGDLLWGQGRGIPVCNNDAAQESPKLCPDGQGGAFFTWADDRNVNETNRDIYAQRVDSDGNLMWGDADEGEALCTAVEEQLGNRVIITEAGTAMVLWEDKRANGQEYDIYAQRITGENAMEKSWGEQGEPVVIADRNQSQARLYPDGEGGAYFVWEEERFGGFPEIDIWAQRLNSNGQRMWAEQGVRVCGAPGMGQEGFGNQNSPLIRLTADGGAVIAWADMRTGSIHLYTQRLTTNGDAVWDDNGIAMAAGLHGNAIHITIHPQYNGDNSYAVTWQDGRFGGRGPVPFVQYCQNEGDHANVLLEENGIPVITGEGIIGGGIAPDAAVSSDGGMLVVWEDHRQGQSYSIYAQKMAVDGSRVWGDNGTQCAQFAYDQNLPLVCDDGNGGAIVAWRAPTADDYFDIYMQRIDSNGDPQWGSEGLLLTGNTSDETLEAIISDGEGGAVVLWNARDREYDDDLYIERVNAAGEKLWGDGDMLLVQDYYKQHNAKIVRHQNGFVAVWVDGRDDELGQSQDDIYGQFILPDGTFRWEDNGYLICGEEFHQKSPDVTFDNAGNIWIVWEDSRSAEDENQQNDIYLQKLSQYVVDQRKRPEILFTEGGRTILDGISVCSAKGDQVEPKIVHDGINGVYITWEDYRNGVWSDVFCAHLQHDGSPYANWDRWGELVCGATHKQNSPYLARITDNGESGVVLVWEDKRATGKEELSNVYVQRMYDGTVSAPNNDKSTHPTGYALESAYPNPFNSSSLITFVTPRDGKVDLKVFDITGRFVSDLGSGYWSAGRHVMVLDGSQLAAGVYIVRLETNNVKIERNVNLLK